MFDRYNKFIAVDDPEIFRYHHQLKAMGIKATAQPYLNDLNLFAGYRIGLAIKISGIPCFAERLIPIGSLEHLPDDSLEMMVDSLYAAMIVDLFEVSLKR